MRKLQYVPAKEDRRMELAFFQEVIVCCPEHQSYGKGLVLGVGEEKGNVLGYVVPIHGMDDTDYFSAGDLEIPGNNSRGQFY